MPLQIDPFNKLIKVTSPTVTVDAQTLHDFIEDYMVSPVGMANDSGDSAFLGDIIKPEGKIDNPSDPGNFTIIVMILNSEWQIQFWGGSGYTRIFGGKVLGGVSDQPMKASGSAGDITVLESPVDGTYAVVATGSAVTPQDILDIGAQAATDVFATVIENTETFLQQMRLIRAEAAGDIEKTGINHKIKSADGGKDRIDSDADSDGRVINSTDVT